MSTAKTTLPEDLLKAILQSAETKRHTLRDAVDEAVLAVLHRPLTSDEQWALIDHLDSNPSAGDLARAVLRRLDKGDEERT